MNIVKIAISIADVQIGKIFTIALHLVSFRTLNMDSNPRTLTCFVDDAEQKNFVSNIPSAVRFYAFISCIGDSFKITKFEKLSVPTSLHGEGSRSWKWGKKW
ncbi:MAG: hypothetical protein EZS28_013660 [Streblomastix strix]|uniref:Uncharacterized protein n=1 Tax=Streblomastix strix TaxID=222440 RepID=A0A5J4W7Y0_9EUKA|nr:MAG: hypothetical protein EZS28_013660 [Streblomastix strix]